MGVHGLVEEKGPSCCVEGAFQSLLLLEDCHDASFEGVGLCESSGVASVVYWDEGVEGLVEEGNAACLVEEPEDAGVGLGQVAPQVGHRRTACFQTVHRVVHQEAHPDVHQEDHPELRQEPQEDHREVHPEARQEGRQEDHLEDPLTDYLMGQ